MIVNSLLPILAPLTLTDVRVTHPPPHKTVAILLLTMRFPTVAALLVLLLLRLVRCILEREDGVPALVGGRRLL